MGNAVVSCIPSNRIPSTATASRRVLKSPLCKLLNVWHTIVAISPSRKIPSTKTDQSISPPSIPMDINGHPLHPFIWTQYFQLRITVASTVQRNGLWNPLSPTASSKLHQKVCSYTTLRRSAIPHCPPMVSHYFKWKSELDKFKWKGNQLHVFDNLKTILRNQLFLTAH